MKQSEKNSQSFLIVPNKFNYFALEIAGIERSRNFERERGERMKPKTGKNERNQSVLTIEIDLDIFTELAVFQNGSIPDLDSVRDNAVVQLDTVDVMRTRAN